MERVTFRDLGLSEHSLREIEIKGFEEPTEIQAKVIPLLLSTDKDIIGQAQTGTGKTAAFGLPIMEMVSEHAGCVQAIVVVPTRELAIQVSEELNSFRGSKRLHVVPIYGGQSMQDQIRRLARGVDIVVGTPGRIMDHLRRRTLKLDNISYAVLDEADEMLNMGFVEDIEEIFRHTNQARRTLLFSATMPSHILKIARNYMHEYVTISIKKDALAVDMIDQIYFEVSQADRFESLCRIIDIEEEFYGLVFCRTKVDVDQLAGKLIDRGYDAEGLHGDFSQNQRERTLEKFRKKHTTILVATDVAARGIDVADLTHVINYALPQDHDAYVHRIGRTGRAGKKGIAITFISSSEYRKLQAIINVTKASIRKKQLPKIADVIHAKKMRIATEIAALIEKGDHRDYLDTARELMSGQEPHDVLAALLRYSFRNELDSASYNEIHEASVDRKGTTRIFVGKGSNDGITPRKLLKLIKTEADVDVDAIKGLVVKDTFSFLTVPFAEAELIIQAFKEHTVHNRPLVYRDKKPAGSSKPSGPSKPKGKGKPNVGRSNPWQANKKRG
ncbi:MAG: DEAD/DEAH box helicase [Spirochaetes bacterium]|nr:MAG: DEAD/DEAH box helicase [Spirochaetota bacterium]